MSGIRSAWFALAVFAALGRPAAADDGPPKAGADDGASIDAVVSALYGTISGDAGTPRDWDRFRALFAPGARLSVVGSRPGGQARPASYTPDDFAARAAEATKNEGFHERETSRKVEMHGSIAHVLSAYETFKSLADPTPFARGVNSIQLVHDGGRWAVQSILWERGPRFAAVAEGKPLEIFFIDVLGGAATLIVTPERESILLDTGWPGEKDRDPERIVRVLRDVAGLDRLDHLVTTHWHTDHYGGVAGLARRIPIIHYWDRGYPEPGATDSPPPTDPLMAAYLSASAGRRWPLYPGDSLPLSGKLTARVLASSGRVIAATAGAPDNPLCAKVPDDLEADPSDNARSLAVRFSFGEFTFLDCGDLTWNVEKRLICPKDLIGPIDLYQVTHHGMSISNHPTLLETVRPSVAIVNNGPRKGGDPKTLERLRAIASIKQVYQLHRNVAAGADGNVDQDRIANPDPAGGQFIRVTVAPDGSSFAVRIGADGADQSYSSLPTTAQP
jgi:competence protein ComEC